MPMTALSLTNRILTIMSGVEGVNISDPNSRLPQFAQAIAEAVIAEIQTGVVNVAVTTTGGNGTGVGTII